MKIEHVALYVNNLEGARTFFVNYLGGSSNDGYHNKTTAFRSYFNLKDDRTINTGSRNRAEAERIAREFGKDDYIAIYNDNGDTLECIGEIHQDEFETE